ncbi:GntR family transcriptional regulator [Psychromarinibacter halotolerans]|uniref:GntR family transcriptional regulator n=1 Tax=Psychromarinibacter halotolerans TaxID=1775175 RepID=A0ABV7GNN2_9RHOB|nr:GntR family transcriptional regulator [Psychromarinibacter halotolerans]MDF0596831.1 GntR family transcriptional regulator [Psychromarinibacter halotolerans]
MKDGAEQDQLVIDALIARLETRAPGMSRYQALTETISEAIGDGTLPRGSALPGERVLSDGLGVSRVTVRRAIEDLAGQGILMRKHGARTTVAKRVEKTLSRLSGFSEDIRSRGMEPGLRWLSRHAVRPTPKEVMALGIMPDQTVVRLRRVRLADGHPIALECATIPEELLPEPEFAGDSLYAALDAAGARPVHGTQRIRAGVMDDAEAALLDADPGTAMLIVERRCTNAEGRPVEFTETRYNGNYYDFVTELSS